jgi:hypothetical protein
MTPAVDPELCNRADIKAYEKNVTWLNADIPGAESVKTGPLSCHSIS